MAIKWAGWLCNPCRLGDSQCVRAGDRIEGGPQVGRRLQNPCLLGAPQRFKAGDNISGGPQVGHLATYPLSLGGSPMHQSGGQNQRWPINVLGANITPAHCGVPNASQRGTQSEVAHKWAGWLHNPSCLGGPQRFTVGDKISSGSQKWGNLCICS